MQRKQAKRIYLSSSQKSSSWRCAGHKELYCQCRLLTYIEENFVIESFFSATMIFIFLIKFIIKKKVLFHLARDQTVMKRDWRRKITQWVPVRVKLFRTTQNEIFAK